MMRRLTMALAFSLGMLGPAAYAGAAETRSPWPGSAAMLGQSNTINPRPYVPPPAMAAPIGPDPSLQRLQNQMDQLELRQEEMQSNALRNRLPPGSAAGRRLDQNLADARQRFDHVSPLPEQSAQQHLEHEQVIQQLELSRMRIQEWINSTR